jgi:hypothetical protein
MLVLTLLFFWGFTLSGTFFIKNSQFSLASFTSLVSLPWLCFGQFVECSQFVWLWKLVGRGNWKFWKFMSDNVSCSNELVAICEFGFLELYWMSVQCIW